MDELGEGRMKGIWFLYCIIDWGLILWHNSLLVG